MNEQIRHAYEAAKRSGHDERWYLRLGRGARASSAVLGSASVSAGVALVAASRFAHALGWIATVAGVALLVGGLAIGLALSLPVEEYTKHRAKRRRYKRMMWDISNYVTFVLPTAKPEDVFRQLAIFTQLREEAGDE